MKIGLKIWSTNEAYIEPARALFARREFDYIELFTVPGSADRYLPLWKELAIPFILHAPHSYSGLNMSLPDRREQNLALLHEVEKFVSALQPGCVVFHPGTIGSAAETCSQLQHFFGIFPSVFRIAVIENKPYWGLKGERCVGATVEEIRMIIDRTSCRCCLDFGHAIASAASRRVSWQEELRLFMRTCAPQIFHLCDGDVSLEQDQHLNLGRGNYDLHFICGLLKSLELDSGAEPMVTLETKKKSQTALDDFSDDVALLRGIWANA